MPLNTPPQATWSDPPRPGTPEWIEWAPNYRLFYTPPQAWHFSVPTGVVDLVRAPVTGCSRAQRKLLKSNLPGHQAQEPGPHRRAPRRTGIRAEAQI